MVYREGVSKDDDNIHGTEIKTLSLRELLILNIRPVNYRENL
jgi:hypothetical protein